MADADPLLSELCSICHINAPKYRCPRCSTRTCSLPCTRRHKLWSQCSGVRDPAAYLRRNELTTESAFDRDFNFITGIERSLERAERESENRGIEFPHGEDLNEDGSEAGAGRKRKHPGQGLVKGEAGFLRGAEAGRVRVIRAPKGMSRSKQNASRWHPKNKCLSWSVEWVSKTGEKSVRNALEVHTIAEAYDRAFPLPKHERRDGDATKESNPPKENTATAEETTDAAPSTALTASTEAAETNEEPPSRSEAEPPADTAETTAADLPITPHRGLYFYLHRPRTTTKKPVLVPLPPSAPLKDVLRERTVLEFPTVYTLSESTETLLTEKDSSSFILEEEYLRTVGPEDAADKSAESGQEDGASGPPELGPNLHDVDENKVLEVLKQDLFEPAA